MKICLVCSHGGHLTELLQLMEAFEGHEIIFASYYSGRDNEIRNIAKSYFIENIGTNLFRLLKAVLWSYRILRHEKPDVIISSGAEIALPFFYLGKLFGLKTIFIEGLFRVEDLSKTGRLIYPVADVFFVQWPQLLEICGPKARYEGSII